MTQEIAGDSITESHKRVGSGGLYTFKGANREAVKFAAEQCKSTIDYACSPSLSINADHGGGFIAIVKYFSCN